MLVLPVMGESFVDAECSDVGALPCSLTRFSSNGLDSVPRLVGPQGFEPWTNGL